VFSAGEDRLIQGVVGEVIHEFGGDAFAHVDLEAEVEATHEGVAEVGGLGFDAGVAGGRAADGFILGLDATGEGQALGSVFLDEHLVEAGGRTSLGGFVQSLRALFGGDEALLHEKIERGFVLGESRNRRKGGSGDQHGLEGAIHRCGAVVRDKYLI
jgi:hypothetical protein